MTARLASLLAALTLAGCDGASIVSRARPDAAIDAASLDVFAFDAPPADVAATDTASLADAGTDDALPTDAPADAAVLDDAPVYDAAAISGWLSGNVYDGARGTPIANAVIRADGAEIARSDADGAYSVVLPRGVYPLRVEVAGMLPYTREVPVGEAPRSHDIVLVTPEPARQVTPAGTTLTTPEGVSLTFPPDAVRAPVNVSATWLDADRVAALDVPEVIDEGDTTYTLRGALVVSDLVVDLPVRVRIPLPPNVLASEVALRALDDARGVERLDPVASGEGSVEFEVPHFSAWGLVRTDAVGRLGTPECAATQLGTVEADVSDLSTMSLLRGADVIPLPDRGRLTIQCNEQVRTTGIMSALFQTPRSAPRYIGVRYTVRALGSREAPRFAVSELLDSFYVSALLQGEVRLDLPQMLGTVIVTRDAAAEVRQVRCQSGIGFAVANLPRSGNSVRFVNPETDEAVAPGTERVYCRDRGAPSTVEFLDRPPGACFVPADCAAPAVCARDQRCVLPRGAACTGSMPCAYGSECTRGRCEASTVAPGEPVPCGFDGECPSARCDLRVRACRPSLDPQGARPCSARSDCGRDEACSGETGTCVPSPHRRCAANTDCPTGTTCGPVICVAATPFACKPDPGLGEGDQGVCPDHYRCTSRGACEFRGCPQGEGLCGGRCVRLDSETNCGACGVVVPARPNASPVCHSNAPALRCNPGFGDCDGNAVNGCEATLTDATRCGACWVVCAGGQSCIAGRCAGAARLLPLEVVVGRAHACARRGDGTLSCWGQNRYGQLGDGTVTGRAQPVTPPVQDVIALAAGANHTCAITRSAALWCWGYNVGSSSGANASTPRMILANVVEVAAGASHTCARMVDGAVWCWGENNEGQLGDGTTTQRLTPTRVTLPPGLLPQQLGLGFAHTCVRGADGAVWCWGRNDLEQVGDGTRVARLVPTRARIGGAEEIAVAGDYVLLRQADGTVRAWGSNLQGQFGEQGSADRSMNLLALPGRAQRLAAGAFHACFQLVDQRVLCAGSNDVVRARSWTEVMGFGGPLVSLRSGDHNVCAVRQGDAAVLCWGNAALMAPSGLATRSARPLVMQVP
jgi:alpha-tubulin suppressor-like RCC1 family protein